MTSKELERRADNGVCHLILARSHRRNALGAELVAALVRELESLEADANVGAIVLEGSAPGFCAGSDLKELAEMDLPAICAHETRSAALARRIASIEKPVVAAVEGFAIGGGFMLAAACDVVVTAENVCWQLPEVSLGWIPPWGLELLAARVTPVCARRLAFGVDAIDGREAYRLGIADLLVADGESATAAQEAARKLAALPQASVASTKRFFGRFIVGTEASDMEANQLFADDCRHGIARETLQRLSSERGTRTR